MCGINLCFGREKIELMNAALSHRGIRSKYREISKNIYLGHVRLPIQGLSREFDHPYSVGNITGAFVGEIFNYKRIDSEAKSDVPVLIGGFEEEGIQVFDEFDGFWSAILKNDQTGLIYVITDFLAKKPLYMRTDTLGISSEMKALFHLGPVTPNKTYFSAVAKWGYCPDNSTPFNEIEKIPPSTQLVIGVGGAVVLKNKYNPLKPSTADLLYKIRQAVENRIVSDVPVSILMSGGLDSTIIYYILREFLPSLNIFHIDNDEAEFLKYIDFRSTDKITTLHIDDKDYSLDNILWFNDGPVDLGSMIPQYLLAREVSNQGFNVCISGDGADELFGGYRRAKEYDSQYSDIFHELVYYHLPRLDKMMMSSKVELRSPFLARGVIESALSIPYSERTGKQVLKNLFSGQIPKQIIDREKKPLRYKNDQRHKLIKRYQKMIWGNKI